MWNPASSRRSPALTELSTTIYRCHQPCGHPSCSQPTSLCRLMTIFQTTSSFSIACLKLGTINSNSSLRQTYLSPACGTLLPHISKAGPCHWKFKLKIPLGCSLQRQESSSVVLQDTMGFEACGSAQKCPPENNSGKGESEALHEPCTKMRRESDSEVFKHESISNGQPREDSAGLPVGGLSLHHHGNGYLTEGGYTPATAGEGNSPSHGLETKNDGKKMDHTTSDIPNGRATENAQPKLKEVANEVLKQQPAKYEEELRVAFRAVHLACMLTQRIQDRLLRHEESASAKNDHSLVTIADWGVQAVVSWVLSQAFPNECLSIVAEEDTENLRGMDGIHLLQRVVAAVNECLSEASVVGVTPPEVPLATVDVLKAISRGNSRGGPKGRHWVLDPVDGTLGFVRGDQYAVALAMIEDGQVVLGLLGCPNFPMKSAWLKYEHKYYRLLSRIAPPSPSVWHKGCVMTAIKGQGGAWMEPLVWNSEGVNKFENASPLPIHVSSVTDPAEAAFCEPVEKGNSSHNFSAGVANSIGLRTRPLRIYSMAKYAAIARGDAEIFMKFAKVGYREKIWDHAAGVLIVEEAGGVVTDARGRPLDFSKGRYLEGLDRGIIACAGTILHSKIIAAVDDSWSSSTL